MINIFEILKWKNFHVLVNAQLYFYDKIMYFSKTIHCLQNYHLPTWFHSSCPNITWSHDHYPRSFLPNVSLNKRRRNHRERNNTGGFNNISLMQGAQHIRNSIYCAGPKLANVGTNATVAASGGGDALETSAWGLRGERDVLCLLCRGGQPSLHICQNCPYGMLENLRLVSM